MPLNGMSLLMESTLKENVLIKNAKLIIMMWIARLDWDGSMSRKIRIKLGALCVLREFKYQHLHFVNVNMLGQEVSKKMTNQILNNVYKKLGKM